MIQSIHIGITFDRDIRDIRSSGESAKKSFVLEERITGLKRRSQKSREKDTSHENVLESVTLSALQFLGKIPSYESFDACPKSHYVLYLYRQFVSKKKRIKSTPQFFPTRRSPGFAGTAFQSLIKSKAFRGASMFLVG